MPFENPKFIPDLVITNPTAADLRSAGDDHLRAIKEVLIGDGTVNAGSFTSNFTGQYTGTADELQSTVDQIIPASTPDDGDVLVWDTNAFVIQAPAIASIYEAAYTGYGGEDGVDNEVYFSTETYNTVPAGLATIENPRSGGGWILEAVKKCKVDLNVIAQVERTGSTANTAQPKIIRNLDTTPVTLATARSQVDNAGGAVLATVQLTVSVVLDIGETLSFAWTPVAGTLTASNTLTVQEAA